MTVPFPTEQNINPTMTRNRDEAVCCSTNRLRNWIEREHPENCIIHHMKRDGIKIDCVSQFVHTITGFEQRHVAQWFFRGHADESFKLIPSLYRVDLDGSFSSPDDLEDYMLEAFCREATPHLQDVPADRPEWQALAQHYGLPTRLLDWTTNPLVGLYFAVDDRPNKDATVWCLGYPSTNNCHETSTYFSRRKTLVAAKPIYFPRHISPRVTNQAGCFTVHDSPVPLDEQAGICDFWEIRPLVGESRHKASIVDELFALGVHSGFIMPGLEGIARRLRFEVETKNYRQSDPSFSIPGIGLEDIA